MAHSGDNKAPGNCSAFIATGSYTKDGKIVIGHNNWTEYIVGQHWNVIADIVPEKGNHILMDCMPGYIHSGDDFLITANGILITETTITQFALFDTAGGDLVLGDLAARIDCTVRQEVCASSARPVVGDKDSVRANGAHHQRL